MRELKIRIDAYPDMRDRIMGAGGHEKGRPATYTYIYFRQPEGSVLKITKRPGGTFKTVLTALGETFDIVEEKPVEDVDDLIDRLTAGFGIKKKLTNRRTFFTLGQDELSLNDVAGVGNFLIIEGENPSLEVAAKLGIKNPEVITVSFDEL